MKAVVFVLKQLFFLCFFCNFGQFWTILALFFRKFSKKNMCLRTRNWKTENFRGEFWQKVPFLSFFFFRCFFEKQVPTRGFFWKFRKFPGKKCQKNDTFWQKWPDFPRFFRNFYPLFFLKSLVLCWNAKNLPGISGTPKKCRFFGQVPPGKFSPKWDPARIECCQKWGNFGGKILSFLRFFGKIKTNFPH